MAKARILRISEIEQLESTMIGMVPVALANAALVGCACSVSSAYSCGGSWSPFSGSAAFVVDPI